MNNKFDQIPQMIISDLETLKVISDPLRLKLIEAFSNEPITVKQAARLVGVPQSKLYYHVGLLEKHGVIAIADTQVVSGIVEKWYQTVAESYRIDHKLFKVDPGGDTVFGLIMTVFETTLAEIRRAVDAGLISLDEDVPGKDRLVLDKSSALLTPEQAGIIRERIQQMRAEFIEFNKDTGTDGQRGYSLLTGFYPRQVDDN